MAMYDIINKFIEQIGENVIVRKKNHVQVCDASFSEAYHNWLNHERTR